MLSTTVQLLGGELPAPSSKLCSLLRKGGGDCRGLLSDATLREAFALLGCLGESLVAPRKGLEGSALKEISPKRLGVSDGMKLSVRGARRNLWRSLDRR